MALSDKQTCVIEGASHGGVAAAFALRKEGWQGSIVLIDSVLTCHTTALLCLRHN